MTMKVESFDGKRGRTVLAHMVTSTPVLARVAARWTTRGLFGSPWENVVGTWCVEFYRKHDKAPRKAIRTLYEQWAEHHQDKDTARLVERFLAHVSEEHEAEGKLATDHVLDIAGRHFNEVAAVRLKEDIESAVDAGRPDKVTKLVNDYKEVQIGSTSHIDVFLDKEAVLHAFSEEPTDSLITFGNDLDRFFSRMLQRKSFVAFQGPEKSAKSFWLNELAYLAMLQRNRVAFFAIGDLTEEEMIIRIAERAAQRPSQQGYSKWPVKLKIPTSLTLPKPKPGEEGELVPKLTYELKSYENPLTGAGAWNTFQHITQRKVKSKNSYFRMSCHPSDSITIVEVRDKVRDWAADGFSADVICIASGSLVLTDRGLVPIENIRCSDRLWDGVSWVSHGGLVYKGVRHVTTYAGLTATPDHQIWTEDGWRSIESCRQLGLRVAQTECSGREVRIGRNYIRDSPASGFPLSKVRAMVRGGAGLRVCPMCEMRCREVGQLCKHPAWDIQGVSQLFAAQTIPDMVLAKVGGCEESLHQQQARGVESLRGKGYRVPLRIGYGSMSLDHREFGRAPEGFGNRPHRQRWALRTREPSILNEKAELLAHKETPDNSDAASFPHHVSLCDVCGQHHYGAFGEWDDFRGNRTTMAEEHQPGPVPVWDIVNSGPFHRFTVQGLLVHNCIDYMDILAPVPGFAKDERDATNKTWKQTKALAQETSSLVITATQADAGSYERRSQTRRNFSTDKRKYAHVDGLVAINVTDQEREMGLLRLAWLAKRRGKYSTRRECYVAGNLAIASPAILAKF